MLKWAVSSKRTGEPQQPSRLSLDSGGITKPKVPRRRSLGGPSCRRRSHVRRALQDKENVNYMAGCTPCFPSKDLLSAIRKFDSPLKDVSNLTPNTPNTPKDMRAKSTPKNKIFTEKSPAIKVLDESTSNITTPISCISNRTNPAHQFIKKRRILLDHPPPEAERKTASNIDDAPKICIEKLMHSKDIKSTIYASTVPSFEIEYSPCQVRNNEDAICLSTLPLIGSRVFIKNPLYFNADDLPQVGHALPAKKPKIEDNFSMLLNKLSPMSALRFNGHKPKACSEVSPLAKRLASLCFNKMSALSPEDEKVKYSMPKDDETASEMETKMIGERSLSKTESTISDSKMGDATLERMIDDILKSTKKVKHARRVRLKTRLTQSPVFQNVVESPLKDNVNEATSENLNLSQKEKTYIIYDSLNSSEREVKTPETRLNAENENEASMVSIESRKTNSTSTTSTPLHNNSLPNDYDFNLKRQRCVRRKRPHHDDEEEEPKIPERESCLTLKEGIPSPMTPTRPKVNLLESDSFNSITGFPFDRNERSQMSIGIIDRSSQYQTLGLPIFSPNSNCFRMENVSNSSLMLGHYSGERMNVDNKMLGLTLECGIPSPLSLGNLDSGFSMSSPALASSYVQDDAKNCDDSLDVFSEPVTPVVEFRSSRRCLTYSPDEGNFSDDKRAYKKRNQSNGTLEMTMIFKDNRINIHIIRCRNLQRHNGSTKHINAYVKVCVNGVGTYQRTPVRRDSSEPYFGHLMTFPMPDSSGRKVQVSVWHRDKRKRRSEFLGCVSFPLSHGVKKEISGSWCLLSQTPRPHHHHNTREPQSAPILNTMAADSLSKDGEDCSSKEPSDVGGGRLATQQREADEHLFLRYLELDPIEGPDAGPAAVQRKASGNKLGRTPFTTTRRLVRNADQGFGFSVVWTRPPRVERVEAGRAAERAGLLPGDYLVFVDRSNVVTMPESQVLTLIKSSGTQLVLETFRRTPGSSHSAIGIPGPNTISGAARGSIASHVTISEAPCSPRAPGRAPSARSLAEPRRRPAALPHLAFTRESMTGAGSGIVTSSGGGEHIRALHAVVLREQQYSAWMQFGMERYVVPLSTRTDVITAAEHKLLFQNCEELLRLSEDILEQIVTEEGEVQLHLIASVYLSRLPTIISLYKAYCNGLKRADCVLVQRMRQQGGNFVKMCTEPAIPRRRPDVTQFVHKPLEQFRELLRLLRAARSIVPSSHHDYTALVRLVNDLQNAYLEITAGAGLMGPLGEGRPLLSVADLESRLVFTRCKPFTLAKPGRQWIFGGDLARVEGRTAKPYWALLFTDLLLFATVSRDRVLFITEEPLAIANITETCFNVRKKANEFRLAVGPGRANSPTARCGPPVRTRSRTLILRAPSPDLKAVWQSLLLRQICRINSSTGTPLSSPMESPAPLGCYSEVTLDSQQRQVVIPHPETNTEEGNRSSRMACKGAALHLAKWMKSHPGSGSIPPEPEPEIWSAEQLIKRSKELKLLDAEQTVPKMSPTTQITLEKSPSENDHSPSRSTNSDSQITVRSSPVVPETVAVCRQCHKRCFSKPSSPLVSVSSKTTKSTDKTSLHPSNAETPHKNHTSCQSKEKEEAISFTEKCSNISCEVDSKGSKSPEKKSTLETMSEIRSAIIRSRESFFKTSESKESCSSPLNRTSPRSPCSQKSDSSHSTLYSTNSPLSYAHTTCSSIALSNSTGKKSLSPGRESMASGSSGNDEMVQCVIAQEKYLNEVKCVENILLCRNNNSFRPRLREPSKIFMGKTIVERNSSASKNANKCLISDSSKYNANKTNCSLDRDFFNSPQKTPANGDIKNNNSSIDNTKSMDYSWSPLMLMGLSAINPAAHLMQLDSQNRQSSPKAAPRSSIQNTVPNISVVPPTPDFKSDANLLPQHTLEDSPDDSPLVEEPPYLALKRYGTMSSLERLPSDELDETQLNPASELQEKESEAGQGLLGWTARAGNYVVEKMALLNSLAESGAASTGASFFERYLGAGEWRTVRGVTGVENETNEGSGASGEEAWGTPSSGDLSDHAFPDSDHATLSSPTKSSSSCPGDEDTELMMDELLMTPPISGPSLRPLLPRRRLEPLMEEEGSDASSTSSAEAASEITPSPTDQGSGAGAADEGPPAPASPDRTPTNPLPPPSRLPPPELVPVSHKQLNGSPERGLDGLSTSSSTLEGCRSAPDGSEDSESCGSAPTGADLVGVAGVDGDAGDNVGVGEGRLSPRMEMRLALQEGTDMLAEQDQHWDQVSGRCGWVRRPLGLPPRTRHHVVPQNTTLNSSVSVPAGQVKVSAMERLALLEARGARRGTRRPRPTARLMGLVRRRASSDSPERRPYSPRRQQPHERQLDRRFWKQLQRRSSGTDIPNIPA